MNNEEFLGKLNEKLALIFTDKAKVESAMKYSLLLPGKRLRPLFIKTVCEDLGGNLEFVWIPAIAVELFHTGSLVHDDLPQIDDSPLRRGKPSCHIVYGNDFAILAGDGLMLKAFQTLSQAHETTKSMLFESFSKATFDVLIGEALDVEYTGTKRTLPEIIGMYEKKTGALFGFCFAAGAIVSGKYHLVERLERIGRVFGIWFQIIDDLKDALLSEEEAGKTTGRDKALGKVTVLDCLGIQETKKFADNLFEGLQKIFERLGLNKTKSLARNVYEMVKL
ncbi:polyprenyl synthetase family protein [Pseudothermotoga thermarum]|uniref:Polyprenyl synthetase n=1 Tax=Pseudothermotoga thermarum DSM 5069 TaxID=688269 RepID=F7YVW8_9THEM|nr:polyprenyl synthetase family protein [Pseudothermotoga thermarum]AEH51790.1 Polyprenyl synthetase [Pseudothermotoga thermarum DSM 5069]